MEISNSIKSIAITGANSYIGINLIKNCINKKIVVKAYCRDPSKLTKIINNDQFLKANKYNLYENNNYNFEKVDAIIHLAHHRIKISRIKFGKVRMFDSSKKNNLTRDIPIRFSTNIIYDVNVQLRYHARKKDPSILE